jgi:Tfp pilus assembly protein PilF
MLCTRAIDVLGENFMADIMLAGYHLRQGQVKEAESLAQKALSLDRNSPLGYSMLGDVQMAKDNYSGAEEWFRMAVSRAPRDARLLNALGNVIERQGRVEEARYFFDAALKINPHLHGVSENLKRVGG